MSKLRQFGKEAKGATAIEYALLATFAALVIVGGLQITGASLVRLLGVATNGFNGG